MTGGVELNSGPAKQAAEDLLRISQEVTQLLAEMRPDLEAPTALGGGGKTALQIQEWYPRNAENLGQVMDVVGRNADAVGQGAEQMINGLQGNDERAAAELRSLARQAPASGPSSA